MGILKRIIITLATGALSTAHGMTCNETKTSCTEILHWAGIAQQRHPTSNTTINLQSQTWGMLSFTAFDAHIRVDTHLETAKDADIQTQTYLRLQDQHKYLSVMLGHIAHAPSIEKHALFSIQDQKTRPTQYGDGLWVILDNHKNQTLEIVATQSHQIGAHYHYDTHYLGGTRFSIHHTQLSHTTVSSTSMLVKGLSEAFFLFEVLRQSAPNKDYEQIIRIAYLSDYKNSYRHFFQYDDFRKMQRRFVWGLDFKIDKPDNGLFARVFQEYTNLASNNWNWRLHTGIGGTI